MTLLRGAPGMGERNAQHDMGRSFFNFAPILIFLESFYAQCAEAGFFSFHCLPGVARLGFASGIFPP